MYKNYSLTSFATQLTTKREVHLIQHHQMTIVISTLLIILVLTQCVYSIPPACFLSCIAEVSRTCRHSLRHLSCVCIREDQIVGCLIDICPFGNFNSARDHFLGTCLEHGKPTITNPYPPPAAWPPPDYEKNLPKMHEPVYRPEPTRGRVVDPLLVPAHEIADHNNPPNSQPPPSPHTPNWQPSPPNEAPANHVPNKLPQSQAPQNQEEENLHLPKHLPLTVDSPTQAPKPTSQFIPDFGPWFDESDDNFTDSYDPEKPLEWEEMDVFDKFGRFIVVRRPINVPKELRDPSNAGKKRRVVVRGPVDGDKQRRNSIHESGRLVEKADFEKKTSAVGSHDDILASQTIAVSQTFHREPSLEATSLAHTHKNDTAQSIKPKRKRTKKLNRKTSPF